MNIPEVIEMPPWWVLAALAIAFITLLYRLLTAYINGRIEIALSEQRHEFQAGYFDVGESRYDKLLDKYIKQQGHLYKLCARIEILESK